MKILHKYTAITAFCILLSSSVFSSNNTINGKGVISDSIDVLNYSINLDMVNLSYKTISGFTDLTITPKIAGITSLSLWLLDLDIDSILINSTPVTGYSYNDTLIKIPLSAFNPGDTIILSIYYHGTPEIDPSGWGGFYFQNDSSFAYNLGVGFESVPHNYGRVWFPCIDDFVDRATYDCFIRTKNDYKAVCGGSLISSTDNLDGTTTWHWHLKNTIPTYLASIAVGKYVAVNTTYYGIQDTIPVAIYVRTSDTSKVKTSFINLNSVLSVFETRFGPYRWERIGYVGIPFNSGAMEHATNISYPLFAIDGTLNYEDLYAHELSHMWFGNLVTCESADEMWLNEGWASYCEAIFIEGIYGKEAYMENVRNRHRDVLQLTHILDGDYLALYGIPTEYTYASTTYDKGSDVVHTLRGYLGDSLFFSSVKQYLETYQFNHASSNNLRDFISVYTGIDLTSFFEGWVYAPGFPHFSIDSFSVNGSDVTVYIRQRLNNAPDYYNDNILEITFMDNNFQYYTDTIKFSGAFASKTFDVPFTPHIVMIDKNEKISDAITDYCSTLKSTGETDFQTTYCSIDVISITDSAFIRIEHNWIPPDPLKIQNPDIIRLSDHRYWKIDGIFPQGFKAKAKFKYSKSISIYSSMGYLDNTLLKTSISKDSILLLYRQNTADDWKIINFTISGTYSVGTVILDSVFPGEYTFAIGKPYHADIKENEKRENKKMKIYPNPSNSGFTIEWDFEQANNLIIFDGNGKQVDSIILENGIRQYKWFPGDNKYGIYYFSIFDSKNNVIANEKIIYIN